MANGKIQIKDGAGNNLFPKVRTIDMTDSAGNVKLFDGEKIRPQFIPNAVDDIVPYAAVTSNAGVATVSQQADYHYINVTSKKIYATVHNGTSFVWDGGSALNTTTLYTSNGKSFRWDGTNLVEIVLPKAMASAINTNTNTNEFVPTVAATTAYFQPKGNYAATGHNHNGTYVSKIIAGKNITLSPATGTGGEITISATDTNTNLVSSVKGANGLTQNASTGNVIISGIDTKGDSSTKGVVITTSVITSNAGGNTSVVPTMNAIYTALAGKANTNHTHNYASQDHVTIVSKGDNTTVNSSVNGLSTTYYVSGTPDHIAIVTSGNAGIAVTSAVNGNTTTYYVSNKVTNTDHITSVVAGTNATVASSVNGSTVTYTVSATNTNLVSSVKGANGLTQNQSTGNVIISGVDTKGDGSTKGVVITSNAIVSTVSTNAATGSQAALETSIVVPTMRAVYNMSSALNSAIGTKQAAGNYATSAQLSAASAALNTAIGGKANSDHTHNFGVTKIIAGKNVTINPTTGVGEVTISATDTNTNLVSSVTGYNGLSANPTTGVVKVSGINTKGDGTTIGVVVTSNGIVSTVATNATTSATNLAETSYIVPTMRAVYNALAGKAATDHNHDTAYAPKSHNHNGTYVSKIIAGKNITLSPTTGVGGEITISATDTNTNLVSSVKGANGLTQNASTGNVIISGVDTKGDGSTKGVVITKNGITSNAAGNTSLVPTMNAVYNALANKADTDHNHSGAYVPNTAAYAVDGYFFSGLSTCEAMRSKYANAMWTYSDAQGNHSGTYPGWVTPIQASGMTEAINLYNYARGYESNPNVTSNVMSYFLHCAVPTFYTFADAVSELSSAVESRAVIDHNHNGVYATSNTSYTAAQLSTNHTHNYAAANHNHDGVYVKTDHITIVSKGTNTTVSSSVNGTTTTYWVSATNTSYTAAQLSSNHSHASTAIVGLQDALGGLSSGKMNVQAAHPINLMFFSGLTTCQDVRDKYQSALWSNSGASGHMYGWVVPISAVGITEVNNILSYARGYSTASAYNVNAMSPFLDACAVPAFTTFATAVGEVSAALDGKADSAHTHTGYATSNTSYTAAQLSTNHSHALANGNYGSGAVKTYSGVTSVATSGNTCVVPTMNAVYSELKMRPNILEGGTLEITSILNFGAVGGTTANGPTTIKNKLVASHNTIPEGRMVWVSAIIDGNQHQGEFTDVIHAGFWYKAPITGWTWLPTTSAYRKTIYCTKDNTEYKVVRFAPQFNNHFMLQASVMEIEITASASATAAITTLLNGGGGGVVMTAQATAMAYVGMSITRKL